MLQTTLGVFFVENYAWSSSIGFETKDALEIRKIRFWVSDLKFLNHFRLRATYNSDSRVEFFSKLYVETQEKGMQSQEISLVAKV